MSETASLNHGKVIILGDSSVGKTSLILRFYKGIYDDQMQSTVGASYVKKEVEVKDQTIILNVWDTAGQERYKSIIPMYMRGCNAILLVAAANSEESIDNLKGWKELYEEKYPEIKSVFVVLNKSDLVNDTVREKAYTFADENGFQYYETSAKENYGIDVLFYAVAAEILKNGDFAANVIPAKRVEENSTKKNCC